MMRPIATLLLILALPLRAAAPAQRLDQLLKTYFPANKPGAAVIVTVDGKPFHRGAYGMANLELNVPLKSDHVFRMKQPYSAGGLVSTVGDLAKWYDGLLAGNVVKRELLDRAWTPSKISPYGYGWYTNTLWGHPAIEHAGGLEGFRAHAMAIPSKRVVVAVLANSDTPPVDPGFVAAQAASFALGQPYDPKAVALPAGSLDAYIGTYRSSDGTQRTICREDKQLVSQRLGPGGRRSPLTPMGKDRFFFTASFLQAHFERDANGNVSGVVFERPGAPPEHAARTSRTCN